MRQESVPADEIENAFANQHAHRLGTRTRTLLIILSLLLFAHLIQIFSPMRLDLDATSYLSRTIAIVDGEPLGPTWLPPGYSYMLAGLELLGIGNAWTFAGLNWLFLVLGVGASYYVLRREMGLSTDAALVVGCMTLLSFVFVKYVPMPLGDTAYFGLSMLVLALLSRLREGPNRAVLLLILIVLTTFVAILTRTIGITLAAGLVGLAWSQRSRWRGVRDLPTRENRAELISIILGLLMAGGAAAFLLASRYVTETAEVGAILGIDQMILNTLTARLRNWGELFLNAPRSVAPDSIEFIYYPAALIGISLVLYGFWKNRDQWGPAEGYFAAYFLALMIYPGPQTRYWLPVVPLMLGWVTSYVSQLRSFALQRFAGIAYSVCFAVMGIGAIYYSSAITFAGEDVTVSYGDGTLAPAYEAAYGASRESDNALDKPVLVWATKILQRYDPRLDQTSTE